MSTLLIIYLIEINHQDIKVQPAYKDKRAEASTDFIKCINLIYLLKHSE